MTQIETNNEIEDKKSLNFIEQIVEADLKAGKNGGRLNTRFPPEPNGYLHIGHAKAICMDFGIAEKFGGTCNLRFDDTNPVKEDVEYVDSIMEDIHWLGFDWGDRLYYASDYFPKLWDLAIRLIKEGKAYVDEQSSEEIARQKGTPTQPGIESPYRNRSVEENLDLFERMNKGEFEEGRFVLRAKIDMASPNMHFRDPIMYRIIKHPHHRTGTKWNVYPMYDFAHGQSDYFEGVTHSICTLEFEVHRPLYEYFVKELADDSYCPRQIEFNRLNLTYTVMSKRKLLQLVKEGLVAGWDDPRMPTICGLRRRGYTPESIKNFIQKIGYTKYDGIIRVNISFVILGTSPKEYYSMEILDKTDLQILRVLQNNSRLTTKELAAKVNLSPTPVFERVKRLEANGYIKKYVAVLDPAKLNRGFVVFCSVKLRRLNRDIAAEFTRIVREIPEVTECYNISGDYDYLLKIHAPDMKYYQEFIINVLGTIESMGSLMSTFVMDEVKHEYGIPL